MKLWRLLLWTNSRRFRYVPISVYSRVVSHSCLLPDHKVLNDQGTNSKWRNARSWWSPRVHGIALASISLLLCGDSNRECVCSSSGGSSNVCVVLVLYVAHTLAKMVNTNKDKGMSLRLLL